MIAKSIRLFLVYVVLLVFLFNNFGRFVIFKVLETNNYLNIQRILASDDKTKLFKLEIPWHDLNNKERFVYQEETDENEILYKGHIFNVASNQEVTDEGITFYGVNDPYEEALIVKLNESENEGIDQLPSNSMVNPFSKKTNDFLAIKYFAPDNSEVVLYTYNRHFMLDYNDVFLEVLIPPPLQA